MLSGNFLLLRQAYDLLGKQQRSKFWKGVPFILFSGMFELLGIALILPFIKVCLDREAVFTNKVLHFFYTGLSFNSADRFAMVLGILTITAVVLSNGVVFLATKIIHGFSNDVGYSLAYRLYQRLLQKPYAYFLTAHTATASKRILSDSQFIVNAIYSAALQLIAKLVSVASILLLILWTSPATALSAGVFFGVAMLTISKLASKQLKKIDAERYLEQDTQYRLVMESFACIKELKLYAREKPFYQKFEQSIMQYAKNQSKVAIISITPKILIEVLAISTVLSSFIWIILYQKANISTVVSQMTFYLFAFYRLLPAVQGVFGSLTLLNSAKMAFADFYTTLTDHTQESQQGDESYSKELETVFREADKIVFDGVSYCYPGKDVRVLKKLTMTFQTKRTIALVGHSGSGKTTIVDLLIGLLTPVDGEIRVGQAALSQDNMPLWKSMIGYVPQKVNLFDDSVANNIAFFSDTVDQAAVERAARMAHIHDFIINELSEGYDTKIGDKGIQLSGGQCQRLAIARALYRNPFLLVMDEATSALDTVTESAIVEALDALAHQLTIVIIAHRISTVKNADIIYVLNDGSVEASGTYDELNAKNTRFRSLAGELADA